MRFLLLLFVVRCPLFVVRCLLFVVVFVIDITNVFIFLIYYLKCFSVLDFLVFQVMDFLNSDSK
jgi:hypothetical protein